MPLPRIELVVLTHTHTRLTALCPGLPGWAGTRKVKPIWILLKHETVSGSGISWAICKSAPRSRQISMPAPHYSVFYRPDALPATQPTASRHWRHKHWRHVEHIKQTTNLFRFLAHIFESSLFITLTSVFYWGLWGAFSYLRTCLIEVWPKGIVFDACLCFQVAQS